MQFTGLPVSSISRLSSISLDALYLPPGSASFSSFSRQSLSILGLHEGPEVDGDVVLAVLSEDRESNWIYRFPWLRPKLRQEELSVWLQCQVK